MIKEEKLDELFYFNTACPKYKEQVISLNNVAKWHRFHSSKIKNEYKNNLKDFYIPEAINKYKSLEIHFQLYRHNKRTLDSDNLGFIIKWTIDAIKELNWVEDDDEITYKVNPAILNRDLLETEIEVKVFNNN